MLLFVVVVVCGCSCCSLCDLETYALTHTPYTWHIKRHSTGTGTGTLAQRSGGSKGPPSPPESVRCITHIQAAVQSSPQREQKQAGLSGCLLFYLLCHISIAAGAYSPRYCGWSPKDALAQAGHPPPRPSRPPPLCCRGAPALRYYRHGRTHQTRAALAHHTPIHPRTHARRFRD